MNYSPVINAGQPQPTSVDETEMLLPLRRKTDDSYILFPNETISQISKEISNSAENCNDLFCNINIYG